MKARTNPNQPTHVIGLFAKYWQPGKVKTRLAKRLGANGSQISCQIYVEFLTHLVKKFSPVADQRVVVFSPDSRAKDFEQFCSSALSVDTWQRIPQLDSDLGMRMRGFFAQTFEQDSFAKVVVIGSDSPQLCSADLKVAFDQLEQHDVVLGPSTDGGYYLIGMKQKVHEVFSGIRWSEETVLTETIEKLDSLGASYHLLQPLTDVDELEDLTELIGYLKSRPFSSTLLTDEEQRLEQTLLEFLDNVMKRVSS